MSLSAMSAVMAQQTSPQTEFHIAPQPLDSALLEYARQSGLELIAVGELSTIPGRYGVRGKLDNREALRLLLHGSGLHFEFQTDGMVIVMGATLAANTAQASKPRHSPHPRARSATTQQMAEMTVTARLHKERMIDVPIAMTAMSGEDIRTLGLHNIVAVARMTPGVGAIYYGGGFTSIHIRGISTSLGGNANGYYLDGVPFTGVTVPWFPDARAWDLDRVEILKGPQGTTFGEGSMGGTVRIIAHKPELDQFEAALDLNASTTRGGSHGWGIKTMLNVPLVTDQLALRVDATDETVAGWIDDSTTGQQNINQNHIRTQRIKLRYAPDSRLTIDLSWWKYWLRTEDGLNLALDNMTTRSHHNAYNPWDVGSAVVNYELDHSHWFYAFSRANLRRDSLGMFDPRTRYGSRIDIGVRTQELRWSSRGEHVLEWTLGTYLRQAKRHDSSQVGSQSSSASTQVNDGFALYGEMILKLPDPRWSLTTGLRYFSDRIQARSATTDKDVLLDARFISWNPRLGLAFKPVPGMLLYTSVARGFRSGQLQPITSFTTPKAAGIELPTVVRPDSIVTYEVGAKTRFDHGRIMLNGDIFHSRWTDVAVRVPINTTFNGLINSAGTRTTGIEVNLTWNPNTHWTVQAGGSYVDASYVATVAGTPLHQGSPVYNVPATTLNGAAAYRQPLHAGLDLTAHGVLLYNSPRHTGLTPGRPGDPILSINARLGLESGSGWSVYVYGDNLTNENGALTARNNAGLAYRLQPRSLGIELSWSY